MSRGGPGARKYARADYADAQLAIGDEVVDLQILGRTGRRIVGKVSSLCTLSLNGREASCVVVRGDDRSAPGPSTAWVVCDEVARFRKVSP